MVQAAPIDIEKTAGELAVRSFEAFCEDIGGMFGVEISCSHEATLRCTIAELKKNFSKLSAVSLVAAKGAINREFRLIFDKKGLFALAGTVMMLPEERTHQLCKLGDVKNAQEIADSVCEIGNLLVGSWDRIFREAMEGHGHFVKKDVFIGDPLLEPSQHLGASADDEILCVTCSMTVAPYAPFKCGAIFPIPLLLHAASEPPKAVEATAVAEHPKDKLPENTTPDSQPAAPASVQEAIVSEQSTEKVVQPAAVTSPVRTAAVQTNDVYVKDIMSSGLLWVDEDSPVGSVFKTMESQQTDYALVGKNGLPSGIISSSDVASTISPYLRPMFSQWRRPQDDATLDIKVKWIMSKPVRMIEGDTAVNVAVARMLQWHVGCLPVTDASGKILGMITQQDLMKLLLKDN